MDVRSITTQKRIKEAFLSLLENKSFAMCSVSDIVDSAEVSKKSFYTYYNNKFDLIQDIENQLIDGLKEALKNDRLNLDRVQENHPLENVDELVDLEFDQTINYCDKYKTAFSRFLSSNGDIEFLNRLEDVGTKEILNRLPYYFNSPNQLDSSNDTYSMKIIRMLYAHIIVGLLCFWMMHSEMMSMHEVKIILGLAQKKSPLELMAYYHKMYDEAK